MKRGKPVQIYRSIRAGALLCTLLLAICPVHVASAGSIVRTKHDLSVTGPGPTKSAKEREICVFCHTPHGSNKDAPLWNRSSSGSSYTLYSSSTVDADIGQPTGNSKLCLSCHDGTIALGMVKSRSSNIEMAGGVVTMPEDRAYLGTDLADDHPISFIYDSKLAQDDAELRDPSLLPKEVKLDHNGMVQCTTCHDAHDNDNGNFLTMNNTGSALCVSCHQKTGWRASIHSTSGRKWQAKTVAEHACSGCHRPHTAGKKERLLNFGDEELNCYVCHNGKVAGKNIEAQFKKASIHDVEGFVDVHDPVEDVQNPSRHVECFDCHNGHMVTTDNATAPAISGALLGVPGMDADRNIVENITRQYELCYRCHAGSTDSGPSMVNRELPETDVENEFDTSAASYHPVEAAGRNGNVPSLISPLNENSVIYCTDCHSGDDSAGGGSSAIRGPHGSKWEPILERQLDRNDGSNESASRYAMCYKCHSRSSILGDQSFEEHKKHIDDEKTACTTCHDSHGVVSRTHLLNFNLDYVSPSSSGRLDWQDEGNFKGSCWLTCHGEDHDPLSY
jgi:predicted CXXCH cytochrome family protein